MKPLRQRLFIILFILIGICLVVFQGYALGLVGRLIADTDLMFWFCAIAMNWVVIVFFEIIGIYLILFSGISWVITGVPEKISDFLQGKLKVLFENDWEQKPPKPKLSYWDKRYQKEDAQWRKKYDEVMGKLDE